MQKRSLRFMLLTLLMISVSFFFTGAKSASSLEYATFPQELEYDITEINETAPLEWYLYVDGGAGDIHRGFAWSNVGGKISVTFNELHDKGPGLWVSDPDPVPYGDINIYKKENILMQNLNFTATNVSTTEMGYIFLLGYMGWIPGFIASLNWTENGAMALAQADIGFGITADVTIENKTESVIYTFNQTGGFGALQYTQLEYSLTTGALLKATTEFNFYYLSIEIVEPMIPGYSLWIITAVGIATIANLAIIIKRKRK